MYCGTERVNQMYALKYLILKIANKKYLKTGKNM